MPYFSLDDPALWNRYPARLRPDTPPAAEGDHRVSVFLLGEDADNPASMALRDLPPGHVTERHSHNCIRWETILRGSVIVGDTTYGVGTIMTEEPNVAYGPYVAGPEGCTSLEIFSSFSGMYLVQTETSEGETVVIDKSRDGFPPHR